MKHQKLIFIAGLSLMLSSCSLLPEETTYQMAPISRDYSTQTYTYAYAARGDITLSKNVPVSFVPVQTKSMSFKVGGEMYDEIYVKVGDTVEAGQLLAQLDVESIETAMQTCEREKSALEMEMTQQEAQRQLDLERARLQNEDVGARTEAEKAVNETYDARMSDYEDRIEVNRLVYAHYQEELEKRQIRAPFAGTVTYTRSIDTGDLSVKDESVVIVADSTMSLFRARTDLWDIFNEGDLYTVLCKKVEYEVQVTSEAALGLEETEKTEGEGANVYFVLTTPTFELEDGVTGTITLVADSRTDVLLVPEDAVTTDSEGYIVYCPNEDGIRVSRRVEVGLIADDKAEIISGLEEGDCVIIPD